VVLLYISITDERNYIMYCALSVSNKEFLDFILTNKLGFKEKLIFVHQRNIGLFDWLNIKKRRHQLDTKKHNK